jgi:hypothetical protein
MTSVASMKGPSVALPALTTAPPDFSGPPGMNFSFGRGGVNIFVWDPAEVGQAIRR